MSRHQTENLSLRRRRVGRMTKSLRQLAGLTSKKRRRESACSWNSECL